MALLHSEKFKPGSPLPSFHLTSVDGKAYSAVDFQGKKALVVMFICNHCPYVNAVEDRILELARFFTPKGIQFVGVCSNDPTDYPDDAPASLLKRWSEKSYGFPYLIDETQDTARAFGAVCTPDIFVYDQNQHLAYHGQIDNNWKDPAGVTHQDLTIALEALLTGSLPPSAQTPSMGCSIKWRPTSR